MKITMANYPESAVGVDVSVFTDNQQKIHKEMLVFGGDALAEDQEEAVQNEIREIVRLANASMNGGSQAPAAPKAPKSSAPKTPAAPKTPKSSAPKTPRTPAAPKTPKAAATVTATKQEAATSVRGISKAVALIKGFVNLLNSGHTKAFVEGKLRGIQRAMLDGSVTKTTAHAKIVDECQDFLLKALSKWPSKKADEKIKLDVSDEATKAKLIGIVGGEKVFESVAVMKAYVGLTAQAKPVTQTQLDNLMKRTVSPKILTTDPFQAEIKAIQGALKAAKPGKLTLSTQVGLAGIHKSALSGIPKLTKSIDSWAAKGRVSQRRAVKKKARKSPVSRLKASKPRVARSRSTAPRSAARRRSGVTPPTIIREW